MLRPLKIVATGRYIPETLVTSDEIDHKLGKKAGWTERQFGIKTRHYASPHETTSFMAAMAADQALEAAGLTAGDVDLFVGACGVAEQPIPSTAVLVQERLGLGSSGIPAFDVNSTCLSFITGMDVVADALALGRYNRVLIFSSEIASCGLDWSSPEAAAIFGDGAAAVIVERSTDGRGVLASSMATYGEAKDACVLASGGTRMRINQGIDAFIAGAAFRMDGRRALKTSIKHMGGFIDSLLAQAGKTVDDIDLIVPHQASNLGLRAVEREFKFGDRLMTSVFPHYGNQIAASIPSALHEAISTGRLRRGQNLMLLGTSAGISLGGMVMEY